VHDIAVDGSYDIDVEYGNVSVDTFDYLNQQWIHHGIFTINSDTPAIDIPTLLGITTPATDADLLVFQALAADAANSALSVSDSIASKELSTTEYLINSFDSLSLQVGDIVKTLGYYTKGDGGGAEWVKLSEGSTVSQSPSVLATTQLSDSTGNLYKLVAKNNIVDIKSVGGIGGGDLSLPIIAATNGASSVRKILDLGNDNISVTGTITFPNTLPIIQGSRGAIIGDGTGDVIISNSESSNGKKKVFGTIAGMDRALVAQGSINNIEFHTLSGCRQGIVMESLTSASSDRSLDNIIKGVQIGECDDAIVFQQYADSTVQQGNEIHVNFLSGVTNGVVFADNGGHTKQGDWDSNNVQLQAIDNQRSDASFLINKTSYPVNNQTIESHSWNGGLLSPNSNLIKGAFRGCKLKFITASPTTADEICSLTDSTKISTCTLGIKRAGARISTTAGEMVSAISTQELSGFNGGVPLQANSVLIDYTLTTALQVGASNRAFVFHALAYSLEYQPFTLTPFNQVTFEKVDLFAFSSIGSTGNRGMISLWMYNKTTAILPVGTNVKMILSVN
jgi:hypothetical protein